MKYLKSGKLKLERGDVRVGNFVYSVKGTCVCVCDINKVAEARVSLTTSNGMLIKIAMDEGQTGYLENYASLVFTLLCTVPDQDFMECVIKESVAAIHRRPELYNAIPADDEKDEQILREVQGVMEEQEELKKKFEEDGK